MNLIVFPTSRALRAYKDRLTSINSFLPKLITVDEFEKRAIYIENKTFIDDDTRVILLKKAAEFDEFKKIGLGDEFFIFLKNSSYFFRFFEELSLEGIDFSLLEKYDVYAEFFEHLNALKLLKDRYILELEKNSFFDKITLPSLCNLNESYIKNFKKIEIYIEGFLTRFELNLFNQISNFCEVILYFKANRFNKKMQNRFEEYGFEIKKFGHYGINLSKKIIEKRDNLNYKFDITYLPLSSRLMQNFYVKKKVFDFINSGIKPENIAIVLPDENFKNYLKLFDEINNLNFAMGFDLSKSKIYKALKTFESILGNEELKDRYEIERFNLYEIVEKYKNLVHKNVDYETFGGLIRDFYIYSKKEEYEIIEEELKDFKYLFNYISDYSFKKKLHLFLSRLSQRKIEDNRGGKITVLGLLETRGINFDGVIVIDFNEGFVPKPSEKDIFLNSFIRKEASLPTKKDRENLQKYYYYELFRNAKKVAISYIENETSTKSRFLEEFNVKKEQFEESDLKKLFLNKFNITKNEEKIILEYNFKNISISPTKLKDFLECKRRYYYKYVKKLKSFEMPTIMPVEYEIGNILHKTFMKLYSRKNCYENLNELKNDFKKIALDYVKDKNLFFRLDISLWIEKLNTLFENEIKRFKSGFYIYKTEEKFYRDFEGFKIEGTIDRIDFNGKNYQIIDYKSGKVDNSIKKDFEKITDFQLVFYYLLTEKYLDVEGAYYYDLSSGTLKKEMQLEEKKEFLKTVFEKLNEKEIDFSKCDDIKYCKFCPYKIICDR